MIYFYPKISASQFRLFSCYKRNDTPKIKRYWQTTTCSVAQSYLAFRTRPLIAAIYTVDKLDIIGACVLVTHLNIDRCKFRRICLVWCPSLAHILYIMDLPLPLSHGWDSSKLASRLGPGYKKFTFGFSKVYSKIGKLGFTLYTFMTL
jgi:hypothetical protein